MDCFALLDDCAATDAAPTSRLYTGFRREVRCGDPATLDAVCADVDTALRGGLHAVVLADYEWGARLIGAGHEAIAPADAGALRFLLFERLDHLDARAVDSWLAEREHGESGGPAAEPAPAGILDVVPSVDRGAFCDAIARIHAAITAGETYQVNYTYRLDFRSYGSPLALYRRLRARQPVGFGAFIALPAGEGATHVLSCSPELFLKNEGGRLSARPMKGTASRARVAEGDSEIARMLAEDTKNRAENLMIVDLLRNDLGRIAETGSVKVPALFSVEPYQTVFQMTSTIEARLPPATGFAELVRALFPCGSITGAPKHRTMQIIAALETTPRGLYTGSIGWLDAPAGDAACGDFCLSVAIRTVTLDAATDGLARGQLGIGAGITIDSRAGEEYEECVLKARFLTGLDPGFYLFETMHATRAGGVRHLDRHLARLAASAARLGFDCNVAHIGEVAASQARGLPAVGASRLRLALHRDGRFDLVVAPLDEIPRDADGRVGLLVASDPIDGSDPFLAHKTTLRQRYDLALQQAMAQGAFDVLFINRAGHLTEGARSNVFVRLDGAWYTPPLGDGLLPGVMRSVLLDDPAYGASERPLTLVDLDRAEAILVCNALRGALPAQITGAC
ncbi:MAG: aminodeoxychorismate synthase component I [Rhodocyclaceae bacterium]|nr:aminodeoxychorismate synthase component I [Rhodocyclaceae bacterium]